MKSGDCTSERLRSTCRNTDVRKYGRFTFLYRSSLIERSLVDHFVPFLPLERRHVSQCAQAEGRDR